MIKIPKTQAEKHATALRIAQMVGDTAIDATKGPQHAAARHAELQAQAAFLVKLWDMNGWNINALLLNTAHTVAEAAETARAAAVQTETADA
jgi:hypothetical protein